MCIRDRIKIDQIFINKMTKNGSESTVTTADKLLKSMSDLIHSVGAQVVIEGISSNDDLNHARAAHADKIQGFLISEALAAGEFRSWVDSYKPAHLQL